MSFKKVAAWTAVMIAGIFLLLLVVGSVVVRSSRFRQYLLSTIEQTAGEALGTRVDIQSLDFRLSDLSADANGITIEGNEPAPYGPLLQVDHLGLNIKVISVFRRQWNLNSITVDHPVAHVFIDKVGNSNIPSPPKSSSKQQTDIFDLAVKRAVLNRGEVYFNDQKAVLSADLHDLQFQSRYGASEGGHYEGAIAYRDGTLQFGSYNSLPHNLQAKFDATRGELKLSQANLSSGSSKLQLDATLQNYSSPSLQGTYRATLVGDEFRRVLKNPGVPSGEIALSGTVQYVTKPNRAAIESVTLNGQMSSKALLITNGRYRATVRDIGASYSVSSGNATIQDIRAQLFGGSLDGRLLIADLAGKMQSQLEANVRGISVGELQSLAAAGSMRTVKLSGGTNAAIKASWNGSLENLVANADASVRATATPHEAPNSNPATRLPIEALIQAHYVDTNKQVSLNQSYVRLPQTSLNFNGTVSNRSSLQIGMRSDDLHELETIADAFRTAEPGTPVQPLGLYGTAVFNGTLQGSTANPQLQGQLSAANLQLKETAWRSLHADVKASPSLLSLQNGALEPAQQGRISFALRAALQDWSFDPANQFDAKISASQLSVADLARIANSPVAVSGTLNTNIVMQGSQLNPVGKGTVVLTNGRVANEPLQSATLSFEGTGSEVHGTLGARLPAGSANSRFTYYPRQQSYDMLLQVANLELAKLHTVAHSNLNLKGVLNVNASGRGTIKNPGLVLSAQIPNLQVQDQNIRGLNLQANVQQHLATIDLTSEAMNTGIRAHGTIGLTDGYQANLRVDTGAIPLQPLFAAYAPQADSLTGQTELHATLRGPLKNKELIEAHAQVPVLTLNYNQLQLGAVHPILVDYTRGVLSIQRSEIRGTDTDLQFQGRIPVTAKAPVSLLLLGNIDLKLLSALQPDMRSSGQIRFDVNSLGERANPNLQGQIRIENANLTLAGAPVALTDANGTLTLTNQRLDISSFQAQMGGGTVTARGGMVIRPALQFDVALNGKGITMLYPRGVRSAINTNLTFTGNMEAALLRGQILLDRLSFTPDFDLSTFTSQFSSEVSSPPSAGFANNVQLQIALQTGSGLNLVSRTLSLQGGANLRIQGTAADPIILGRADVTGGDVIFLANRYVIQGGSIVFVNPTQTEPFINLTATTTINQYNINLRLEGPSDRLRTTYSSDPALPPVDIINLLAFGKTTEAQAANANAGGSLGPESVLASGITSQIAGKIQKIAGISQLSIDPVLGPNQGTQGARITIQQRVTSNLFVTFSTDVTSTQQQIIQVQYQINPRWSVSADRDQNGGFGFDARVHKSF